LGGVGPEAFFGLSTGRHGMAAQQQARAPEAVIAHHKDAAVFCPALQQGKAVLGAAAVSDHVREQLRALGARVDPDLDLLLP